MMWYPALEMMRGFGRVLVFDQRWHGQGICSPRFLLEDCADAQTPYQIRDVDGRPVNTQEARDIISQRYTIPDEIRRTCATAGTSRRSKKSHSDPSTGPSNTHAKRPGTA